MKSAPSFWWSKRRSWQSWLLAPLAAIYRAGVARRLRQPATSVGVPVICVGNLTVGGNGKTPTVIALAERLSAAGRAVHVVSRGYGGTTLGPHRVDPARDIAAATGDEPLLIAQFVPVWVAKDRLAGCQAAAKAGAEVILLDDGFQDPKVAKTASIVVVDAGLGFGNGCLIPAGPLREPVRSGLARADLVLVIGEGSVDLATDTPVVRARLDPLDTGMDWTGHRVLAFAGIGRPEKFFATLRSLGADLVETVELADHEPISKTMIQRLSRRAAEIGAQLVTTEKDIARIDPDLRPLALPLPVRLATDDWGPIDALLQTTTSRAF